MFLLDTLIITLSGLHGWSLPTLAVCLGYGPTLGRFIGRSIIATYTSGEIPRKKGGERGSSGLVALARYATFPGSAGVPKEQD
jgi:hypothetical protein